MPRFFFWVNVKVYPKVYKILIMAVFSNKLANQLICSLLPSHRSSSGTLSPSDFYSLV